MSWVYIMLIFILTDVMLYLKYWKQFARRFYFMNYSIAVGWMMVYKLRSAN